ERRQHGLYAQSDGELYTVFDLTYDYDIWPIWSGVMMGLNPVKDYLQMLRYQAGMYPANYIKMRCVENHDQPRIMALAKTRSQALAWTAFSAFLPGAFMVYAGQEAEAMLTPSLFEREVIEWRDYGLSAFIRSLTSLKKQTCLQDGIFSILEDAPNIQAIWQDKTQVFYGIFNVLDYKGRINVQLPDGNYEDYLSGEPVTVKDGLIEINQSVLILQSSPLQSISPFKCNLIDLR
ncbi:MAG: alpha-amylase, partial [Anaerolineae bacterium]|nr:alpha-amylase [Anaerolineae bacterium]